METPSNSAQPAHASPSFRQIVSVFGKIGLLSFGGPAAQIALMHRVLVDEQRWLDERRFLSALSFCMLLPGPEAMQLATYAGWRLHGVRGGLAAGLLFVLPGALLVLALSMLYGAYGQTPTVAALFVGVKAAVLAIVLQALVRVANRAIKGRLDWTAAAAAFVAIFFFNLPFPLVIAAAAAAGYFLRSNEPVAPARRSRRAGAAGAGLAHAGDLARRVDRAAARGCRDLRRGPRARPARHVLFEARRRHLRWRLRRARLHGSGGGQRLRMAHRRRDARRSRSRRDDQRPAHPRHRVRRLHRGVAARRRRHRHPRRARHAMGDVCALLPVDLRRRPLHRAPDARAAARLGAAHRHRRGRRRHRQSFRVVRAARALCARRRSGTRARCACSCRTSLRSIPSRSCCRRWRWC